MCSDKILTPIIYSTTRVKRHNLLRVDKNSLEQYCAAHIVQCCQ